MTCPKSFKAAFFLPPLAFGLSMMLLWSEVIAGFQELKDGYKFDTFDTVFISTFITISFCSSTSPRDCCFDVLGLAKRSRRLNSSVYPFLWGYSSSGPHPPLEVRPNPRLGQVAQEQLSCENLQGGSKPSPSRPVSLFVRKVFLSC